jgi:hypothetical protein
MQRQLLVVVLAVVALTSVMLLAQERRTVVLEVGLPNGETPQLKMLDGDTGTVDMPNVGKFGFVPTVKGGTVWVEVFDMSQTPHHPMERIEALVGGETVQSKSKPEFGIRVVNVN